MGKHIKSTRFADVAIIGMDGTLVCLTACFGHGGGRSIQPDCIRLRAKGEL
jgi:hypothetical protein